MAEYWQKLRDPRWQRKRLEVFEAAQFSCERCGDDQNPLHAHHLAYRKNVDPWDYPDELLVCLCNQCHQRWHDTKSVLDEVIGGLNDEGLSQLAGYALALSVGAGGFPQKGSDGLLGPSSGAWVKGLHDGLRGVRDAGQDELAWRVAERVSAKLAQTSKDGIRSFVSGEIEEEPK